jgi:hypothetical protein
VKIKEETFYKIYSTYFTIINLIFAITALNLTSSYIEGIEEGDIVACIALLITTLIHAMFFYLFVNSLSLSWKRKITKKKLNALNITQIVFWSIIATICIVFIILSLIDIFLLQVDWAGVLMFVVIVGVIGLVISITNMVLNAIAIKLLTPDKFNNIL